MFTLCKDALLVLQGKKTNKQSSLWIKNVQDVFLKVFSATREEVSEVNSWLVTTAEAVDFGSFSFVFFLIQTNASVLHDKKSSPKYFATHGNHFAD